MYVDDFGGAEETEEKTKESFQEMGNLLKELGLEESVEKAEGDIEQKLKSKISNWCDQVQRKR